MPTIIFKPTEACNSNCVYCDVVDRKQPKTMPLDLLELVIMKMNDYLLELPEENFTLIWHGGEPLLLGVDYFNKALDMIDKHCSTTKNRIEHAIQSNLTLMKQEYIPVFRRMNITSIGTSFEPIQHLRGPGKNIDSEKYNKAFFRGINILKENGIGWGFIYVVTRKALERPLEIFYFLSNLSLTGGFMLNPVLIYGTDKSDIAITPMEYVDFLGQIFPVWWKHRDRYEDVDPFKMIVRNVIDHEDSLGCVDSGRCAYSHLYIGPDGETSQCGRSGDWDMISYGSINERSIREIMEDPKRQELLDRIAYLHENDCKDCRFWGICHGGCPLDAWKRGYGIMRKSEWCAMRKVFMTKYFEPITGIRYEQRNEDCKKDHKS